MTSEAVPGPCPICELPLIDPPASLQGSRDAHEYNCARCGRYRLDRLAEPGLAVRREKSPEALGLLSHIVRKMQGMEPPFLSNDSIEQLLTENDPPSPVEQLQNLVILLGDMAPSPGRLLSPSDAHHRAIVGAVSDDNFFWILRQGIEQDYLNGDTNSAGFTGTLSWEGWKLYQQLKHGRSDGNRAFMAMPFGDSQLNVVFRDCFRPAVRETGFRLFRIDERAPAGSIDDRLRIEIRRSRFLIADLTDGNRGAYWEAGFAEGIGLPVIYSCEQRYFKDPGTHFDTSHMQTVTWNADNLDDAAKRLKTTIRATFPEEAEFEQDPEEAV